ncbi:MAG: hypothetical protein AB7R55_17095 [Gemmatimonadales bacterium]
MHRSAVASLAFCVAASSGCGAPDDRTGVVRDSAGVVIVENRAPRWTAGQGWRVPADPTVVIGGSASPDDEQFAGAIAATRLRDGRILVGDRIDWKVRVYDQSGRQLGSWGRRGQGPGEFQDLSRLLRAPGDSVAIPSFRSGMLVFDDQGNYGRVLKLEPIGTSLIAIPPQVISILPDGQYLALSGQIVDPRQTGTWVDSLTVIRVSASGDSTVELGKHPQALRINKGPPFGPLTPVYGARGQIVPGGPGYCFADGTRYELACYSTEGALIRMIRRELEPGPVTAELKERYREHLNSLPVEPGGNSEMMKDYRRKLGEAAEFADRLPVFRRFRIDAAGNLWVKAFDPEDDLPRVTDVMSTPVPSSTSSWSVFDPDGIWLGEVELPAGFQPIEFGDDYLLGFGRDADDIDQVWQLRIEKP